MLTISSYFHLYEKFATFLVLLQLFTEIRLCNNDSKTKTFSFIRSIQMKQQFWRRRYNIWTWTSWNLLRVEEKYLYNFVYKAQIQGINHAEIFPKEVLLRTKIYLFSKTKTRDQTDVTINDLKGLIISSKLLPHI